MQQHFPALIYALKSNNNAVQFQHTPGIMAQNNLHVKISRWNFHNLDSNILTFKDNRANGMQQEFVRSNELEMQLHAEDNFLPVYN